MTDSASTAGTAPLAVLPVAAADAVGTGLLDAFNEQTRLDVEAGRRRAFVFRTQAGRDAGGGVLGSGELDLTVLPEFRAQGLGAAAATELLRITGDGALTAWSHGDHPAARALAARHGFVRSRVLLQLALAPLPVDAASAAAATDAAADRFASFRPGTDDAEWLALNAEVFAWHPEQGATTQADLDERIAEPWFDADDVLIARDADDRMIGFNWLKVEPGSTEGEVYVIGVSPAAAGRGLGHRLMTAGFGRLAEKGCDSVTLYTEADNTVAVGLYRSLGFVDRTVDVQYSRAAAHAGPASEHSA